MKAGASSLLRLKILVCTLAVVSAYGQQVASLQFCNGCLPSPPDRLVRDVNGNPLVGTNYVAQLYSGASPNSLNPTTAMPSRFRAPGTGGEGTWLSRMVNVVGLTGQPIYLQVAVWDTSVAATYNEAAASSTGQYGKSAAFGYTPCSTPPTAGCDLMLGFLGFRLITNVDTNYVAQFDFNQNRTFLTVADRKVYLDNVGGTPLVGTNYVAQLYYGVDANSLNPVTRDPARFRDPATVLPGFEGTWGGQTVMFTGFSPGGIVTLQVRAWDQNYGATWDAARSAGGRYGQSPTFTWRVTVAGGDHEEDLENFRGFALMTNPPDLMLVIRENGDRVDLLYSGTHTIQGAESLSGPWVTLTTSGAPYTDPASGTLRQRFYRMQDEPGPTYSVNVVGYYRVDACAGFSMVANQLNAPGGNAVPNLLKSPAERTEIYKYSPMMGGYISLSYLGGAWEGDDLEMTLSPGEGAFLYSPVAQSLRFLGEVPLIRSVPIPSGFSIISAPQPRSMPLNQMNFPVVQGICTFQWTCGATGYRSNCYMNGAWEGDDAGNVPAVGLGESFWVHNPGPPIAWNGIYCINCP